MCVFKWRIRYHLQLINPLCLLNTSSTFVLSGSSNLDVKANSPLSTDRKT